KQTLLTDTTDDCPQKVTRPRPMETCGVCVATTVEMAAAPNAEAEIPP
ncbi:13149_t:CDS:2, partial [Racocetra persica]